MKRILVGFALMLTLGACTQSGAGSTTSDCAVVVRFHDREYQEAGFTEIVGEPLGEADLAACDDTGNNARGPYFPEIPEKVAVWSIPGKNQGNMLAMEYEDSTYRVMKFTGTG